MSCRLIQKCVTVLKECSSVLESHNTHNHNYVPIQTLTARVPHPLYVGVRSKLYIQVNIYTRVCLFLVEDLCSICVTTIAVAATHHSFIHSCISKVCAACVQRATSLTRTVGVSEMGCRRGEELSKENMQGIQRAIRRTGEVKGVTKLNREG